jgi:hypothetical protein
MNASPLEISNPSVNPSPSLPLHQPRPCRRIPIVSLAQLASACDDMEKASHRRPAPYRHRNGSLSNNIHYSHQRQSPYSRLDRDRQLAWPDFSRGDNNAERITRYGYDCMEVYPTS